MKHDKNHRGKTEAYLQNAFSDFSLNADEAVWDNIREALHKEQKRSVIWIWAAAAGVAGIVLSWYFISGNVNPVEISTPGEYVANITPSGPSKPGNGSCIDSADHVSDQKHVLAEKQAGDPPTIIKSTQSKYTVQSKVFTAKTKTVEVTTVPAGSVNKPITKNIPEIAKEDQSVAQQPPVKKPVHTPDIDLQQGKDKNRWLLAGNYQMMTGASGSNVFPSYYDRGVSSELNLKGDRLPGSNVIYQPPVIISTTVLHPLSKRWGIETGLAYTLLTSGAVNYGSGGTETHYKLQLHYIGLPLLVNYTFIDRPKLNIYSSLGFLTDKGIIRKQTITEVSENGHKSSSRNSGYLKGIQGGISLGMGAEQKISQRMGFYLQPGLTSYLFNTGSASNIRDSKIFWWNIRAGLRFRLYREK